MWILMVEAGVALFLLVFIVWWTMFAGRKPQPPARPSDHDRLAQPRKTAQLDQADQADGSRPPAAPGRNDTPGS